MVNGNYFANPTSTRTRNPPKGSLPEGTVSYDFGSKSCYGR